ncbi:MAG: hypothetical protein AAGA03_19490 [Planctomycetota bacterium]
MPVISFLLVTATAFWNPVDLNLDDDAVGLNRQVLVKLILAALAGLVGLFGFTWSHRVRRALTSGPGMLLSILGAVFVATSLFASGELATVSRIASVIYVTYLLFVPTALVSLGLRSFLVATLAGLALHLALAWYLFLFVPSVGVFLEDLGPLAIIQRMGGTAHPNALGRLAVLAGLLSLVTLRSRQLAPSDGRGKAFLVTLIMISVLTLVLTKSRTAMLAGFAAAGYLRLDQLKTRAG